MRELDTEEARLLLYCETCVVDHDGRMDARHLNEDDNTILEGWHDVGFIASGRVASEYISPALREQRAQWCRLSEEAWQEAHRQRRLRADRAWELRRWRSTAEKRIRKAADDG